MNTPKLSIITVNFNNAEGLRKTIESVVNQTFTDYEYIIIDGGSTDGSVNVIKEYEDKITYWVSEPDKGIFDAMNKGIKKSKGEYCLFLNSSDLLLSDSVLESVFKQEICSDILYCNVKTLTEKIVFPDKLKFSDFFTSTICHQATFIKKTLFDEFGFYNTNLKMVSDYEFFCKCFLSKKKFLKCDVFLTFFDTNGISNNIQYRDLGISERTSVLKALIPGMYEDYVELIKVKRQLIYYQNSKIIQAIKKILKSKFYIKTVGFLKRKI